MNFKIQVIGNQKDYTPNEILNFYGIIFQRYDSYLEDNNIRDFISFLKQATTKDNKYNNYMVADFIKEVKFEVSNFDGFYTGGKYNVSLLDKIDNLKFDVLGSFVIDNKYLLHFTGSYIYIECIKSKKQYYYYCD